MRLPYFLATLAVAVVGSILLGVFAKFSVAKTIFFAFVILVVSQLVYVAQIVILAAKKYKTTTAQQSDSPAAERSELKIRHQAVGPRDE